MKFIKPSHEIIFCPDGEEALRLLEVCARVCYKSEDKIHDGTPCHDCCGTGGDKWKRNTEPCIHCSGSGWAEEPSSYSMIRKIMKSGHHSVIEHVGFTVRFICNRGVTHEEVRHRLASYSQESTRFCNYSKGKFGGELNIIEPLYRPPVHSDDCSCIPCQRRRVWEGCLSTIEDTYLQLIDLGEKPQEARDILPIGIKTEIIHTSNLREWRHILNLRSVNKRAHPQIREVMTPLLEEMKERIPIIFDDLGE